MTPTKFDRFLRSFERVLVKLEKEGFSRVKAEAFCLEQKLSPLAFESMFSGYVLEREYEETLHRSCLLRSCIPLYSLDSRRQPSQSATGTLLIVAGNLFLLTCAHAMEEAVDQVLMIPVVGDIEQIRGEYLKTRSRPEGSEHLVDAAIFLIDADQASAIDFEIFLPLRLEQVAVEGPHNGPVSCTIAGYPWRKAEEAGLTRRVRFMHMTGFSVPPDDFSAMRLTTGANVLVAMNRKRLRCGSSTSINQGPLPHGMSGGPIITWPPFRRERGNISPLLVCGIVNEFHESRQRMVGTRITVYLEMILRAFPELGTLRSWLDSKKALDEPGRPSFGKFFEA